MTLIRNTSKFVMYLCYIRITNATNYLKQTDMNKTSFITKEVVAVSIIAVAILSSCNKLDFPDGHSEFKKVSEMLYEVTYSDYGSEAPNDSYDAINGDMACSSVRNGDFVGRNFDYYMNQCPTFVIHTTGKEGRYATIGVGRLAGITPAMVEAGLPQEKMELLPWALTDGMNEKGLCVNSNVVSKEDWGDTPHTGTRKDSPELNVLVAIRPLLDHCSTVKEALDYLDSHNITPLASQSMNLHLMISDPKETYVVEFIDNRIVAKPFNIMTNYYLCYDSIPDHATGVERYRILAENYEKGGKSMQGMWELMKMVRYSNLYDYPKYKWYSEYSSFIPYSMMTDEAVINKLNAILESDAADWPGELEYVKEHGLREESEWWHTVHNTIYDIQNKKIWVTVHEWYDRVKEFSL